MMSTPKYIRKIYCISFFCLTLSAFAGGSHASLQHIPDPPAINAVGYILLDTSSGQLTVISYGADGQPGGSEEARDRQSR